MTHTEIVKKLIGSISPVGATHIDEVRLENLKSMCELVRDLINEISGVAEHTNRVEHSIRQAGLYAESFLNDLTHTK